MNWNPSKITRFHILEGVDRNKAFQVFRNSSSGYAKKVREYLLSVYHKCVYCDSTSGLQIDHIKSVRKCFVDGDFFFCNSLKNLQVLCNKCNQSKPC